MHEPFLRKVHIFSHTNDREALRKQAGTGCPSSPPTWVFASLLACSPVLNCLKYMTLGPHGGPYIARRPYVPNETPANQNTSPPHPPPTPHPRTLPFIYADTPPPIFSVSGCQASEYPEMLAKTRMPTLPPQSYQPGVEGQESAFLSVAPEMEM